MNAIPLRFACAGAPLIGMLHPADGRPELGVLIMVAGGPQYRIGGHRQLTLWSRKLSAEGYPVFRFDFRGMGDSYGEYRDFDAAEDDIRAALDRFFAEVPTLKNVVLWGECNACSAAAFFAHKEPRIKGIVMLNPWVRTEDGHAETVIKHYYLKRLTERSFWKKVFRFEFDALESARSAAKLFRLARRSSTDGRSGPESTAAGDDRSQPLPDRMLRGLANFKGQLMLVMSGRDIIAREFDQLLKRSPAWQTELAAHNTVRHELEYADHTFSSREWRDQVASWGVDWLRTVSASCIVAAASSARPGLHPAHASAEV